MLRGKVMSVPSHQHVIIAIDGPSASGKSTVAKELATRLKFAYVDTGAMYRAATLAVIKAGVDPHNTAATAECVARSQLRCIIQDNTCVLFFGEERIPPASLKSREINLLVSEVACIPEVRKFLLALQQQLADQSSLVVEGRDIGTVVFPYTPFKFYLDADPAVREARRRGESVEDSIYNRDAKDYSRAIAPLRAAPDAEIIDTTHMTVEQVVHHILSKLPRHLLQS